MTSDTNSILVSVPSLHPAAGAHGPADLRYVSPGIPEAQDAPWLVSPRLPMPPATARAMMAQFAQLARESRSVADISAFAPGQYDDFYQGSSFAIKDELEAAGSGKQKALDEAKALSRAQTELCLAWALEEYAAEMDGLSEKLSGQWDAFSKTLGLDEEETLDEDQAALAGAKPALTPDAPRVPRAVLLGAILAFVPEGSALYCADESLLADWEEYGVSFSEASPETLVRHGLAGRWREANAPGHLLCMAKRPDPARPWLDAPRAVIAPFKE